MVFTTKREDLFRFGSALLSKIKGKAKPIFLCVGSDKYVSDCLAPIVAEMLRKTYNIPAMVYGGVDYNVNATNLMEVVHYIETMHEDATIILIDATLDTNVGEIILVDSAFAGAGRCLPNRKLGDIAVLGVVGRRVANFNLNSTRLKVVMQMAKFIAMGCYLAVCKSME